MARLSRSGSTKSRRTLHQNSLPEDIANTGPLRETPTPNKRKLRSQEEEDQYVDSKSSRKILKIGQDLVQEELENRKDTLQHAAFSFESRVGQESGHDAYVENSDEEAWGDEEEDIFQGTDVEPDDLSLFNKFIPSAASKNHIVQPVQTDEEKQEQSINLADLILEKIAAREVAEAEAPIIHGEGSREEAAEIPLKVMEVYSRIGLLLSRYKSGKLPKPFKIIPSLPQWQDLLAITKPELWTANACYEATRIFVSSKPHITQIFLETVMLERVRADIHETKKLNVHLYHALKKALYRPAAFFKGFVFPLVGDGTCTLREAYIISSILVKVSIPVLHSAAALLRLTEIAAEQSAISTESAGATNIFIRVLLEKKYALPYKVIDALVFHFLRFRAATPSITPNTIHENSGLTAKESKLPVIWHQCLLAFAQRYRNDITEDQREALLDLLLIRGHKGIGPEVRRELLQGRGRGVIAEQEGIVGGDDTMMLDPF